MLDFIGAQHRQFRFAWRFRALSTDPTGRLEPLGLGPTERVAPTRSSVVTVAGTTLRWADIERELPQPITALAADENRVIAGLLDGSIRVFGSDGRLQHVLHGHSERVSAVALRGDTLWSGGWDAQARRWWLAPR